MPDVTFFREDTTVSLTVASGASLLEAARQGGMLVESPCNGTGTCGKCKVRIVQPESLIQPAGASPRISAEERRQGIVLACTTLVDRDLTVEVSSRQDSRNVRIIQHGVSRAIAVDGAVSKRYDTVRNSTEVWAGGRLLGLEAADTARECYGLVVDIGTTTLVTALFDLSSGRELGAVSSLNPQSYQAQDVLSRIKFASTAQGLAVMHTDFIGVLNRLIDDLTMQTGIAASRIYEIVFSGNTCMLHLALGVSPAAMGKYPYTPEFRGGSQHLAGHYEISVSPLAQIYVPPIMSAYVGADITSGILAARLQQQQGLTLFVDIGTNGEMVLADNGKLIATSTAAGPAFEGMNIENGMRAAPGAVERFAITGNGSVELKTIGGQKPIGICGSGLLDIVGELVKHGLIQKTGKLQPSSSRPEFAGRLLKKEGKTVFQVAAGVFLSQKDIRQVQLAKGAVSAGIEALLAKHGVRPEMVDRVYIAGSFGYHLNPESLINIGMLPPDFHHKIEFLGNTSKTGGQAFLLNYPSRREISEVVAAVEVLELATIEHFDKLFVKCLSF